jgi:hypothetical protein
VSDPLLSARELALVDAVAHRVLELLDERAAPRGRSRLVSAGELATELGVSRAYVYEHADELGAQHVGDGARPRLRFDVDRALAAATRRQASEGSQPPDPPGSAGRSARARRTAPGSDVPLLPIAGRKGPGAAKAGTR